MTSTLIDLFVVSSRIEFHVTIDYVLMKKIRAHANANRIMLGANSNKPPAPASVNKLLLSLLAAKIIGCNA